MNGEQQTRPARARRHDERGIAAVWMAITLFLLLGVAAIAVDLVHGLLVGQEAQNAADAASLAGVVNLPGDPSAAYASALENARVNGFENGVGGVTVTPQQQSDPTKLRVEIKKTVETFFARAIGFDTLTIRKSAIADYDPPVAMGSPANTFGNQPDCTNCSTVAGDPFLWANVEGPLTAKQQGNAYLGNSCSLSADNCSGTNIDYDPTGYFYAVHYKGGASNLNIDIFDAPFVWVGDSCTRTSTLYTQRVAAGDPDAARYAPGGWAPAPAAGQYCTGDTSFDSGANPTTTRFKVLQPDDTPWDTTDNPTATCTNGVSQPVTVPGYAKPEDAYANPTTRQQFRKWWTLCSVPNPVVGDYLVQATTTAGNGNNNFSMRAYGGSTAFADPNVSVAGTNKIAIYANSGTASSSTFYLARVLPSASNRVLTLDFYDVADAGGGSGTLTVLPPPNATVNGAPITLGQCQYTDPAGGWQVGKLPLHTPFKNTGNGCSVSGITSSDYQGKWVTWKVPIPAGYTCNQNDPFDCWFRISFGGFTGGVHDVTTWQARLDGNPVRIVR